MNHRNSDVPADEKTLEIAILTKGLTAPRITPEHINAQIAAEEYHLFSGTCLTVCVLTLLNGFTVTGESACASPENFDAQIGRDLARRNARDKIWSLEGYRLRQQLHEQQQALARFDVAANLQSHQLRVVVEAAELADKIEKLGAFIDSSDTFMAMAPEQQLLLVRQHRAMSEYAAVLTDRIEIFKESAQ